MKIVLDARWIFEQISGIGAYTRELIRNLALVDRENDYLILFDKALMRDRIMKETGADGVPNISALLIPYRLFSLRNQISLPRLLSRCRCDVFHSTNYMIPFFAFPRHHRKPPFCVTTVHDVIPMIFRDHAPRSRKSRYYPLYKGIMREVGLRSDRMVTDSHASRIDVMKHLEIDLSRQDRVRVIPCGVSQRFEPPNRALPPDPSRPRRLLYVGRSDPYKNLSGLVRAFGRAKSRCPFPITLTIAGPRDARYPEASECISQLGLGDAVQWSGYVGDDDLVALYQRSDLLVHASMYEGFGLPIVEAMACGVPVVCSKSGSLPEVAGDAAFLLDWDDTDGFARAIHDVLVHPDLARRMSDEGRRRAAQFTWRRTAEETLALYREFAPNRT